MDPFIGEIIMFGGNFAPRGWAFCDGQLLPISSNSALFSILGTTYGGDGRTTFALPDLRGRVAVHDGSGPGLTPVRLGEKGGINDVTLTSQQMPSHNHTGTIKVGNDNGDSPKAKGNVFGKNVGDGGTTYSDNPDYGDNNELHSGALAINNAGGGQSHTNMQPYQVVNYIIALQGVYPSRS